MRVKPHKHPCGHCHTPTECAGAIQQNYDGHPEFLCQEYHTVGRVDFICDACDEQRQQSVCADCQAWGTEPHTDECSTGAA